MTGNEPKAKSPLPGIDIFEKPSILRHMERKEIYEIRKSLEALHEWVSSFIDPRVTTSENDDVLLDMRCHIYKAIQLSRKLKGGVE